MEIKYLRLIKTIAEEGSMASSAERLFLTQSALSHQLKDLEESLGVRIFLRTRNKWELTDEGRELYALANTVLAEIDRSLKNMRSIREGSKGRIRISTECHSFYQGLPAFIQKMGVLYPDIEIDLVIEATHHPVSKILSNELDMAIVTTQPAGELLVSIDLFEDEIFAVMHKENPLAGREYLEAADFAQVHLIIHSFPLESVSVYEHFLKVHKAAPLKISAMPFTEISLEMVTANMGIMCMPMWSLKSFRLKEDLMLKRIGRGGLKRNHYLTFRKSDESLKYFKDFISNLEEDFQGMA